MKYGIIKYTNPNISNIGDGMQIIAVMNLYKKMGILESEIIKINFYDLWKYDGEEVIVPICFPFYGIYERNKVTCFSQKIIPIFLAFSLMDTNLVKEDILYLKQYEPIGCRDEFTANGLSKQGIKTYVNGCTTLTLNAKRKEKKRKEIYCVDIPESFYQYIPEEYQNDIKLGTHIIKNLGMDTDEYAKQLLEEYVDKAKLVVTSRLHAALPCYAVGIPVIFIHPEYSYRFTWLEDILHVYLPSEWKNIDWSGSCIVKNQTALLVKKYLLEIAQNRILNQEGFENKIYELQKIYERRNRRTYIRGPIAYTISYIEDNWNKKETIKYAVWGVTQVASAIIDYIKENFPLAKLIFVIDAVKTKHFKGCEPQKIEQIEEKEIKETFIFITADAANVEARELFDKISKRPSSQLFCWKHLGGGGKKTLLGIWDENDVADYENAYLVDYYKEKVY